MIGFSPCFVCKKAPACKKDGQLSEPLRIFCQGRNAGLKFGGYLGSGAVFEVVFQYAEAVPAYFKGLYRFLSD